MNGSSCMLKIPSPQPYFKGRSGHPKQLSICKMSTDVVPTLSNEMKIKEIRDGECGSPPVLIPRFIMSVCLRLGLVCHTCLSLFRQSASMRVTDQQALLKRSG